MTFSVPKHPAIHNRPFPTYAILGPTNPDNAHLSDLKSRLPTRDEGLRLGLEEAYRSILTKRGDLQRDCGGSVGTIDGSVAGSIAFDGKPRTRPEWRL